MVRLLNVLRAFNIRHVFSRLLWWQKPLVKEAKLTETNVQSCSSGVIFNKFGYGFMHIVRKLSINYTFYLQGNWVEDVSCGNSIRHQTIYIYIYIYIYILTESRSLYFTLQYDCLFHMTFLLSKFSDFVEKLTGS